MQNHSFATVILTCALVFMSASDAVRAQSPIDPMISNGWWVAARHENNPIPGTDIIALAIKISQIGINPRGVEATVYVYCTVDGKHYSNPIRIPGTFHGVVTPDVGMGRYKRQSVILRNGSIQILATAFDPPGSPSKGLIVRYKNLPPDCSRLRTGGSWPCGFPITNCDEPPIEDILEDDTTVEPGTEDPPYTP